MICAICHGRGWIGHRRGKRDACPACTFAAEREWEAYQMYERMKLTAGTKAPIKLSLIHI